MTAIRTKSAVDDGRGLLWVAEQDVAPLSSLDVGSGQRVKHLPLSAEVIGITLRGDGKELLLSSTDGTLVGLDPDNPGAGPARTAPAR
jgi:hypothetical protein